MLSRVSNASLLEALEMSATPPGGSNHQIQFNNNGTFGGITGTSNDLGGGVVGLPAARVPKLEVNTLAQINSFDVGGEHGISVSANGSPSVIGPIVCQPFLRDTGAGSSLGSVIGWATAYDVAGTAIGKFPIYDNIT